MAEKSSGSKEPDKNPDGRGAEDDERQPLSAEQRLQRRLEANRASAAASRKRRIDLVENLQQTISTMTARIETLRRENLELRQTYEALYSPAERHYIAASKMNSAGPIHHLGIPFPVTNPNIPFQNSPFTQYGPPQAPPFFPPDWAAWGAHPHIGAANALVSYNTADGTGVPSARAGGMQGFGGQRGSDTVQTFHSDFRGGGIENQPNRDNLFGGVARPLAHHDNCPPPWDDTSQVDTQEGASETGATDEPTAPRDLNPSRHSTHTPP